MCVCVCVCVCKTLRGRGGGGGKCQVLPLQNGCVLLAMLKGGGGGKTSFGGVLTWVPEVLAMLKGGGGTKRAHCSKCVCACVWGGGGAKSFGPGMFPYCSPPPSP